MLVHMSIGLPHCLKQPQRIVLKQPAQMQHVTIQNTCDLKGSLVDSEDHAHAPSKLLCIAPLQQPLA